MQVNRYFDDQVLSLGFDNSNGESSVGVMGPSIFALSQNSLIAENVGEAMKKIYTDAKIEFQLFLSPINHEGSIKL